MKNIIRAKSIVKLRNKQGKNVTLEAPEGTDPFELAKHLIFAHAANVGLMKCAHDLHDYIQSLLEDQQQTKH